MKCPRCSNMENKVVDSRMNREGDLIRRRRECLQCHDRFTTYERIEQLMPFVIKKDGRRETFDRNKILDGVQKACQKRPIGMEQIEELVAKVEKQLQESGEKEVSAVNIGEKVVMELYHLDDVAYVRFASVYRSFKDVNEFMSELKDILKNKGG
ncbi:MAG: transcriptional regulator NrdR [Nitrospinales bacterium]